MRVLITGASGYIGRHVVGQWRSAGHELHTLTRSGIPQPGVMPHTGDLLSPGVPDTLIERIQPDVVVHCAWEATPGVYWTSPDNPAWARATEALARAARASGAARFVGVGSCAEYDWTSGHCDEATTREVPATPYGRAKLDAAHAVLDLSRPGFCAVWGRVFFLFGDREHPSRLVPSVASALLSGEPALCSHGEQVRDFLHVTDVADALVSLARSPITGVVNIASGQPRRVRDVIEGLAQRLGHPELIRLGARATDEPPMLTASAGRLREDVGWQPQLNFDEALDAAAAFWRAR